MIVEKIAEAILQAYCSGIAYRPASYLTKEELERIINRCMKEDEQEKVNVLMGCLNVIRFHSGKFSVRYWRLIPKSNLAGILKHINDLCKTAFSEIGKLNE